MLRSIPAVVLSVLLGWQTGAMASVVPVSMSARVDVGASLAAFDGRDAVPVAVQESARVERLLPAARAEIDTLLELAVCFESGCGGSADADRAFAYYQAAALRGDGFAQEQVARFYETGNGVERDVEQALRWYRLAAEQQYPAAQLALARLYRTGNGVAPRPEQAYVWTLVVLGNPAVPREVLPSVQALRRSLERQLRPEQIDAARHRARAWNTDASR